MKRVIYKNCRLKTGDKIRFIIRDLNRKKNRIIEDKIITLTDNDINNLIYYSHIGYIDFITGDNIDENDEECEDGYREFFINVNSNKKYMKHYYSYTSEINGNTWVIYEEFYV